MSEKVATPEKSETSVEALTEALREIVHVSKYRTTERHEERYEQALISIEAIAKRALGEEVGDDE